MESLKIVASGENKGSRNFNKGKLFEQIIAEVLSQNGYEIDDIKNSNVTYAGMEIDIEGKHQPTGIPLYAECKCYSTNISSEKLQTFYGKYMTKWFKNKKSHGLFLALPGINSPAKGFYHDNCENNPVITLKLLQEADVLFYLLKSKIVANPESFQYHIDASGGTPGDKIAICSDRGYFWLQYIIPKGAGIVKQVQFFDSKGNPISDNDTIEYLLQLIPEAKHFDLIQKTATSTTLTISKSDSLDEVVEVRGSTTCFEYQFPAAPEFFVGRNKFLAEIIEFSDMVIEHKTSIRSILFEANSGWGKSSLVLTAMDRLTQMGHYTIAFDSRSASSPHFVLRALEKILDKFDDFDGLVTDRPIIKGVDSSIDTLLQIGKRLEGIGKLLLIFFDQFENIFHLIDLLKLIDQLNMKVKDARTNVVLGFSWKTDLIGLTSEFPYRWRDNIAEACKVFHLSQFSDTETNALLDRLASELYTKLRKDLRFLLSEFSQGYPWLLKKLCAHVKNQRKAGVIQSEMVRGLLNVEQLFLEDLQGLTVVQEEALRQTAILAPVSILDIGEKLKPDVVQSLVDRRLVVRVGNKYDIYWDIFRDYLNTGKLPIEEVYLLRAQLGSIMKALLILKNYPEGIGVSEFKKEAGLSDGAFFNITRDLRLLQLARVTDEDLVLSLLTFIDEKAMTGVVSDHLRDRLPRNRCVNHVLNVLRDEGEVDFSQLSEILKLEFPYISAVPRTWVTYARILASWLDFSNLAILDDPTSKLLKYEAGAHVRERSLTFTRRRSEIFVPPTHFNPVVEVSIRLSIAAQSKDDVDWSGISRSTVYKALSTLEEMNLIKRRKQVITIFPECHTFAKEPSLRIEIARAAVSKWTIFSTFIGILGTHSTTRLPHKMLAKLLVDELDVNWKTTTANTNIKIMLNWVRHLNLVTGPQVHSHRGQSKEQNSQEQKLLFDSKGD